MVVNEETGAPLQLPAVELVSVGELLADLAQALTATANSLTPTGRIIDSQAAFRRLAEVTGRMSAAFAHVQIAVPKEPDSDG